VAACDWVIDMGPGAGGEGGRIVAAGTPREVAMAAGSRTAPYLREWTEPNQSSSTLLRKENR
jgi:excinuclease ABC subunit A